MVLTFGAIHRALVNSFDKDTVATATANTIDNFNFLQLDLDLRKSAFDMLGTPTATATPRVQNGEPHPKLRILSRQRNSPKDHLQNAKYTKVHQSTPKYMKRLGVQHF